MSPTRFIILFLLVFSYHSAQGQTITDALGRTVELPKTIDRVLASGPGCLRLLTYLQAQEMVVAVDDLETRQQLFKARPYAIANPQFQNKPIFGEFRGHDNPELILGLSPQPQVIFKTYPTMGQDPVELQKKTGIPVVVLNYGNLTHNREHLYNSLRLMGTILDRKVRAESVVSFFEQHINDLQKRIHDISDQKQPSVYLGGVAFKGPHGFQSTEPAYPPFRFLGVHNLADTPHQDLQNSTISKEMIVNWNPDMLFVDLSTLQLGEKASGLHELRTDSSYQTLGAVHRNMVYGLLPYNLYTQNFGSILANAYYIGSLLYPTEFSDIRPPMKADEIYTFLVGKPVFAILNREFHKMVFQPLMVK